LNFSSLTKDDIYKDNYDWLFAFTADDLQLLARDLPHSSAFAKV